METDDLEDRYYLALGATVPEIGEGPGYELVGKPIRRIDVVTAQFLLFGGRPQTCRGAAVGNAVRQRDAIGAVRLMEQHLTHVEQDLVLPGVPAAALDLRAALTLAKV